MMPSYTRLQQPRGDLTEHTPQELVGRRTRTAVRELMSDTVLRRITEMWESEGFSPPPEIEPVGGQRVTLFEAYIRQVDWSSRSEAERALRVFQDALTDVFALWAGDDQYRERAIMNVRRAVSRDGLEIDDEWLIRIPHRAELNPSSLASLKDPSAILQGLERLSAALPADPELAIGGAKELMESTAKVALIETGRTEASLPKADFTKLVNEASDALGLLPEKGKDLPDSRQAVRQILNGARQIATGLAEFRNSFGTGHGPARRRTGLSDRHARLAVNAATLWCELILDTLADSQAPWRSTLPSGSSQ